MNDSVAAPEPPVHLYLDFSNVTCGARDVGVREGDEPNRVRLHARNLYRLMAAGRPVASATLVANARVSPAVLAHWRRLFTVVTTESGTGSGLDQAADEILQNRLMLQLFRPEPIGVIVVATGDGAGWRRGIGFEPTLIAARRFGYGVEVLAFQNQLHPRLHTLASRAGAFIDLDQYYGRITFLEGLREALPVFLHHRPTATPRPWEAGELDGLDHRDERDAA